MCQITSRNFTVDIHTHILPEHIPNFREKFGYGGFITLDHHKSCSARMMKDGEFFREVEDNCWSPEARMKECGHHHVDVQVLSTVPVMFSYWAKPKDTLEVAQFLNDHIAEICDRYPTRFVGLGTLPMQAPDLAIQELRRCKEIGLKGVQIGTHINDWNLDAPELFPIFEACQDLDMAIFVHPWDMMAKEKMTKYWLPWLVGMPAESSLAICSMIFGGVFERLPKLRVAFAHGGGSFPATLARVQHGFDVRPDLCAVDNPIAPKEYMGKFWLDSLVHDPQMLEYIVGLVGENRVALGTDYPFPLGELQPGKLINGMPWSEACQDLDMAIFVHPWDMMAKEKMTKYWLPWLVGMPAESSLAICSMIFGGVFERLPKLRVAFAHGGGSFPATLARVQHGFDVRPDLCAVDNPIARKEYMGKFWLDSLVHDPQMLEYIVGLVGENRVALGTDYPFPLGELQPGKLINGMPWSEERKGKLLHGAALEWLGMDLSHLLP